MLKKLSILIGVIGSSTGIIVYLGKFEGDIHINAWQSQAMALSVVLTAGAAMYHSLKKQYIESREAFKMHIKTSDETLKETYSVVTKVEKKIYDVIRMLAVYKIKSHNASVDEVDLVADVISLSSKSIVNDVYNYIVECRAVPIDADPDTAVSIAYANVHADREKFHGENGALLSKLKPTTVSLWEETEADTFEGFETKIRNFVNNMNKIVGNGTANKLIKEYAHNLSDELYLTFMRIFKDKLAIKEI